MAFSELSTAGHVFVGIRPVGLPAIPGAKRQVSAGESLPFRIASRA